MPINQRLHELLSGDARGVFLGDHHGYTGVGKLREGSANMYKVIVDALPQLQQDGVKTLSIELPQQLIDDIAKAPTTRDLIDQYPGMKKEPLLADWRHELVHEAQKHGMKVLGHEHSELTDVIENYLKTETPSATQIQQNAAVLRGVTSKDGMAKRDAYAAEYINANADPNGKIVVFGGRQHSEPLDERSTPQYAALNQRLDIPSIDYIEKSANRGIGETFADPLGEADFKVALLKKVHFPSHYKKQELSPETQKALDEIKEQGFLNWAQDKTQPQTPLPKPQDQGKSR